jgi:hypothetical protein
MKRKVSSTCRDNIRMDIREIGWKVVHWIHLAEGSDQWCDVDGFHKR